MNSQRITTRGLGEKWGECWVKFPCPRPTVFAARGRFLETLERRAMSTTAIPTPHSIEQGRRLSARDSSQLALERLYRRRAMLEELIELLEQYTAHETARRIRCVPARPRK